MTMSRPSADYAKTLRDAALRQVVDDLVQERIDVDGSSGRVHIKRDSYTAKLESLAAMGVTITKNALYQRVDRQYKQTQHYLSSRDGAGGDECPLEAEEADVDESYRDVSGVIPSAPAPPDHLETPASPDHPETPAPTPPDHLETPAPPDHPETSTTSRQARRQARARAHAGYTLPAEGALSERPGRPEDGGAEERNRRRREIRRRRKGEDYARLKECVNAVALDYSAEKTRLKALGKRCRKGLLEELIEEKRAEFGVVARIPAETVRTRVGRMGGPADGAAPGAAPLGGGASPAVAAARKSRASTAEARAIAAAESLAAAADRTGAAARAMAATAKATAEAAQKMAEAAEKTQEEAREMSRLAERGRKEARSLLRKLERAGGGRRAAANAVDGEGEDEGPCKKRRREAAGGAAATAAVPPADEGAPVMYSKTGAFEGYAV